MSNFSAAKAGSRWTPEAIEKLRQLAATPVSCAAIAKALGPGFSRNMVISKANRTGIQLTGKPVDGQWSMRPSRPVITLAGGRQMPQQPLGNASVARSPRKPRAARPSTSAPTAGACAVTLADLRDSPFISQCRWPLGDPRGNATVFCGELPRDGSSYCGYHQRLAYRPWGTVEP